ncbi:MAG: hypothetical protein ACO1N1_17450 [Dyadobacter fermentans]
MKILSLLAFLLLSVASFSQVKKTIKKNTATVNNRASLGYKIVKGGFHSAIPFEISGQAYALIEETGDKGYSVYKVSQGAVELVKNMYSYVANSTSQFRVRNVETIGISANKAFFKFEVIHETRTSDSYETEGKTEIWEMDGLNNSVNIVCSFDGSLVPNMPEAFFVDASGRLVAHRDNTVYTVKDGALIPIFSNTEKELQIENVQNIDGVIYLQIEKPVIGLMAASQNTDPTHKYKLIKIDGSGAITQETYENSSRLEVIGDGLYLYSKANNSTPEIRLISTLSSRYFNDPNKHLSQFFRTSVLETKKGNLTLIQANQTELFDLWLTKASSSEQLTFNGIEKGFKDGGTSSMAPAFAQYLVTDKTAYLYFDSPMEGQKWITTDGTKEGTKISDQLYGMRNAFLAGSNESLIFLSNSTITIVNTRTGLKKVIKSPHSLVERPFVASGGDLFMLVENDGLKNLIYIKVDNP